jgi:hypothetical protein
MTSKKVWYTCHYWADHSCLYRRSKTLPLLPRLGDDQAFNVCLKKHVIHKSMAYEGLVKKGDLKIWLSYLVTMPLYKLYDIKIDWAKLENQGHDLDQGWADFSVPEPTFEISGSLGATSKEIGSMPLERTR